MTTVFRWSARVIGFLGVLMWTFALVANTMAGEGEDGVTAEGVALAILAAGNTLAFLVANRYQHVGGLLSVFTGVAFSAFAMATAGHNHLLAALVSGGPFIAAGVLFMLAGRFADDQALIHSR